MKRFLNRFRRPRRDPDPLLTLFLHAHAWQAPEDVYCIVAIDRRAGDVTITLKVCCCVRTLSLVVPAQGSRVDQVAHILDTAVAALRLERDVNQAKRETETPEGGIDLGPIEFHLSEGA